MTPSLSSRHAKSCLRARSLCSDVIPPTWHCAGDEYDSWTDEGILEYYVSRKGQVQRIQHQTLHDHTECNNTCCSSVPHGA